jgi:hypothetical protein
MAMTGSSLWPRMVSAVDDDGEDDEGDGKKKPSAAAAYLTEPTELIAIEAVSGVESARNLLTGGNPGQRSTSA